MLKENKITLEINCAEIRRRKFFKYQSIIMDTKVAAKICHVRYDAPYSLGLEGWCAGGESREQHVLTVSRTSISLLAGHCLQVYKLFKVSVMVSKGAKFSPLMCKN
jgi:hypothetical protein